MKKIIGVSALALAAVGIAVPAHADNDSNFGSDINAANNWNFSAASVCLQEVAVVPTGGASLGDVANHCVNGNVLDPK
ncbi:hypothetical protein ACFV9W_25835 [Streptomyces sp. NPDC059897]|uniref:hypothetical protein n=1 Tax=Streptomyces sp. NPDC059897 TaxID=3346994 RepID=UPI00365370B3